MWNSAVSKLVPNASSRQSSRHPLRPHPPGPHPLGLVEFPSVQEASPPPAACCSPWSAERANRDQPSHTQRSARRRFYRIALDEQTAERAQQKKQLDEENRQVDRETAKSLATATHVWGAESANVAREREVFHDQVAAMQQRKHEDKTRQLAEAQAETERIHAEHGRLIDVWRFKAERKQNASAHLAASLEAAIARRQNEERERRESE